MSPVFMNYLVMQNTQINKQLLLIGKRMQHQKTKVGILGYGYVGKATRLSLLTEDEVVIHDKIMNTDISIFHDVSRVFICIPTDTDRDIDIIITEIKKIQNLNPEIQIIIRSTLPLGASAKIQESINQNIIYIPEFLRERFWDTDCFHRPIIVGTNEESVPEWVMQHEHIKCSTSEAELVKMFSNNFATVRIAFANVFYDLSQKVGANYDSVKEMFFQVQHTQTYMDVPGHDGGRGFSGKCLPKDLDFLIETLDRMEIDQNWFKHIRSLNNEWTKNFIPSDE